MQAALQNTFTAVLEEAPGAAWKSVFDRHWPAYRRWFLSDGDRARPSYLACRRALRCHMPELVPIWQRLVDLAGGGDVEARFLSLWCPPAYIAGCAQAVWSDPHDGAGPMLVRNYDFAPALLEGTWLASNWCGHRTVAMVDCLWGVLDGINAAGLAVSLSFGGRTVVGEGFGVPLVMRYLLEVAQTTSEAVAILRRLPVHMTYNITLLDASGAWSTVFVAPDRPTEVTPLVAVTNHQQRVEWPEHARATQSEQRCTSLNLALRHSATVNDLIGCLLRPPLFQTAYARGYGTLYTAVYRTRDAGASLYWPGASWEQSCARFEPGSRCVAFGALDASDAATPTPRPARSWECRRP